MQDAKEEVRSRLNIEDVIGEYVQLKRAGRNFRGLSPFSAEKTPSFYVSPDKQIWHDFSSNRGGDVFTFIMEIEGMDFRGSLETLARKAGVDLSLFDNQGSQVLAKRKARAIAANQLAASYYQQSLLKNQHALEYVFKKRGLSKEVVKDFKIGYSPNSGDALVAFLNKKGFTGKELSEAGLTNRFGGDLFRGRMAVALMDSSGQVIGFTGRIIEDEPNAPKYLNTPQTVLYDKSRHVFGLSQAKEAIRTNNYAVIVEGNLDVVSSHQAGIKQVVATAGTAMTEHHLKALSRLCSKVLLAFDGDKAGLAATERAIPIAQFVGIDIEVVTLPDGYKDPDELIKFNPQLWQEAIDSSTPAGDWLINQYAAREDLTSAAGQRQFTSSALSMLKNIIDPVVAEYYVKKIAEVSGSSIEAIKDKLASGDKAEIKPLKPTQVQAEVKSEGDAYQDDLLAMALIDVESQSLLKAFEIKHLNGEDRQAVAEYIINHTPKAYKDTPKGLQKYDTYVKILLLKAEARYANLTTVVRQSEVGKLLRRIAIAHRQTQKDSLLQKLRDAEVMHDDATAEKLRQKINKLIKEAKHAR